MIQFDLPFSYTRMEMSDLSPTSYRFFGTTLEWNFGGFERGTKFYGIEVYPDSIQPFNADGSTVCIIQIKCLFSIEEIIR